MQWLPLYQFSAWFSFFLSMVFVIEIKFIYKGIYIYILNHGIYLYLTIRISH